MTYDAMVGKDGGGNMTTLVVIRGTLSSYEWAVDFTYNQITVASGPLMGYKASTTTTNAITTTTTTTTGALDPSPITPPGLRHVQ